MALQFRVFVISKNRFFLMGHQTVLVTSQVLNILTSNQILDSNHNNTKPIAYIHTKQYVIKSEIKTMAVVT